MFVSHSSRNSRQAIAVTAWLVEQEPRLAEEIYLDVDPHTGIRPGERWKQALQRANARCEAVICLLSTQWEASRECRTEFRHAETLNKAIVVARLEPMSDTNITSEWQRCDLFVGGGPTTAMNIDSEEPVVLATEGLHRLLNGLRALGIGRSISRGRQQGTEGIGVRRLEVENQDRDEHGEHTVREKAHPVRINLSRGHG